MASWYRFTVTPSSECARLRSAMIAYSARDEVRFLMKRDVAVFCRSLLTQEHFQFYFTPSAAKVFRTLIEEHGGVPCGPPPLADEQKGGPPGSGTWGDLTLLVGSNGALDVSRESYLQLVAEVRGEDLPRR
jgi:hypothetical protein